MKETTVTMRRLMSRRQFAIDGAALALTTLAPRRVFGVSSNARRVVVRTTPKSVSYDRNSTGSLLSI